MKGERTLGVFGLKLAILPGELIPVHVFEPRYKLLIGHCLQNDTEFCVPFRIDGTNYSLASKVRVESVDDRLPDGRMNLTVKGTGLVRIHGANVKDKPYPEVRVTDLHLITNWQVSEETLREFNLFCERAGAGDFSLKGVPVNVYDIADSIGADNREKKLILKNYLHPGIQENILLNALRMSRVISQQEALAGKGLMLN